MATIRERISKSGTASYQVRWLQGGRGGSWESERFEDPTAADAFKKLVDAHGQQWPYGWIPGQGFVEPDQDPDDMPLTLWARRYVERLTGIDQRTRDDYSREVDRHLSLLVYTTRAGQAMPATIGNLTADDIQDWGPAAGGGPSGPEYWPVDSTSGRAEVDSQPARPPVVRRPGRDRSRSSAAHQELLRPYATSTRRQRDLRRDGVP